LALPAPARSPSTPWSTRSRFISVVPSGFLPELSTTAEPRLLHLRFEVNRSHGNHHRIVNHRYSPVCILTHSLTLIDLASVSPYFIKVPPLTRAQRSCRFPRPLGKAVPRSCECSGPPCPRRISFWYVLSGYILFFKTLPSCNRSGTAILLPNSGTIKLGQSQLTLLPARPSGSASRC
jgi:hypothetical protein